MRKAGLRRSAHAPGHDAQQPVGQVLEVVHPLFQERIVDLLHARAGTLLDTLDCRFGGEATVDRRIDAPRPALVVGEHAVGLEYLLMLARNPELGLLRHVVDLLAHLAEGAVDAGALGLDVVGDGVLDDDPRLVEDGDPLRHTVDEPQAREAQWPRAAKAASAGTVDEPRCGDHLRQHHRHGLQRLDLDILVAARVGVLDGEDTDRAFKTNDRHSGEAVVALLARLGLVEEGRVLGGLGEVQDAALGGDGADQALAHVKPRDVDCFLAQAVRREQLEIVVAKEVDGADVAIHFVCD